jgi:hypothetical protein
MFRKLLLAVLVALAVGACFVATPARASADPTPSNAAPVTTYYYVEYRWPGNNYSQISMFYLNVQQAINYANGLRNRGFIADIRVKVVP